ncbi:MAG: HPr(Ser) kinase/phosphatase [Oscillospiraceae bacterium]|nr:HPr(Ser) kinase/phosphatase [Candidatus Equicaccousia limihippi]
MSLDKVIEEFNLEQIFLPRPAAEILVESAEVNRPALPIAGYFEFFDNNRIQIIGKHEHSFLQTLSDDDRALHIENFFKQKPTVLIFTRQLEIEQSIIDLAGKYGVALLRTDESTSGFISALIAFLNVHLAPRVTRHGVLVEVYGEGILILGDSGVGKSETAIELVKRGHRLIADDAVELRKVSSRSLVGSAPSNIRHFIELRGIGIINASRIFGVGAVKLTEKVDMVISLEQWDSSKVYDRIGLEGETTEILDIKIPSITIPVKPGRNLAVIIEVAAMNNRQKKLGYNAAQDLLTKLGMEEQFTNTIDESDIDPYAKY